MKMSHLFQLDCVKYICCCGSLKPICGVYFCRHCLRLRCFYCVSQEVDAQYCGHCSENVLSAEAKQKKFRCATCFDCPSCRQTLIVRAATIQVPSEEEPDKLVVKKVYYLACGFCRYTSRESGIPDAMGTSGPWPEPDNPESKHILEISDYIRQLAVREKNFPPEKKPVHKTKFLAAGRHGLAHLLPKRFPQSSASEMNKPPPTPFYHPILEGEEELDELPEEFFLEEPNLAKVTNLSQRLHQLETQPETTSALLPTHKHLLVKRSLRCRVCERNISKPEYSPSSIKFKIQLNAYYHVPQVRLMAPLSGPLLPGYKTRIVLRVANSTQFPTSIKILPFAFQPLKKEELTSCAMHPKESSTDISLPSYTASPSSSLTILPAQITGSSNLTRELHVLPIRNEKITHNVNLATSSEGVEIILPPKDDTLEFEGLSEAPDFNDDPKLVPWRKANKAAVYLDVERDRDGDPEETPVLGITVEYDYVNTIVALESKGVQGPQKVRLQVHLLVDLSRQYSV